MLLKFTFENKIHTKNAYFFGGLLRCEHVTPILVVKLTGIRDIEPFVRVVHSVLVKVAGTQTFCCINNKGNFLSLLHFDLRDLLSVKPKKYIVHKRDRHSFYIRYGLIDGVLDHSDQRNGLLDILKKLVLMPI